MIRIIVASIWVLAASALSAQAPAYFDALEKKLPDKANKEFQFLAFFYNHAISTNVYPTNDFLKGQVLGRLYGQNTTTTTDSLRPFYFEQRILPFFLYSPKLFNGKATLRASFEIDFTWGDAAYGTGGNFGAAPSADQVNLQTQNIELELIPKPGYAINLGLQRMYDTPHNPYRTFFEQMLNTGYRLNYWGTDGVGVSVRRDADYHKWKLGYYQLYENNIQKSDDVSLFEINYCHSIGLKGRWGGSLYHVRDRANGQGGPSVLGQGLNSTLNDYNGTYRFPFAGKPYQANVYWLGTYFSYNESQMMDQLFLNAYVNYNFGTTKLEENEKLEEGPSIGGLGANLRLGYRYGQTPQDAFWIDAIYTSGDDNGIEDDKYSGVMTGNTWGTPAGLYVSHGGYLLFPHANVVNRYVAAVTDISNLGLGVSGLSLNVSKDFVPNKFSGKVGAVAAKSNAVPEGGGSFIGWEANAKLAYQLGVFMSLELHAAHLWLGDFYDSPQINGNKPAPLANPYTAFVAFRWLMF